MMTAYSMILSFMPQNGPGCGGGRAQRGSGLWRAFLKPHGPLEQCGSVLLGQLGFREPSKNVFPCLDGRSCSGNLPAAWR